MVSVDLYSAIVTKVSNALKFRRNDLIDNGTL